MKDCRRIQLLCPEFQSGTLEPAWQDVVRDHLSACPECIAFYGQEAALDQMIADVPSVAAPDGFERELAFRLTLPDEPALRGEGRRGLHRMRRAAFAATAILAVAVSVMFFLPREAPAPSPSSWASRLAIPAIPATRQVYKPTAAPAPRMTSASAPLLAAAKPVEIPLPAAARRTNSTPSVQLISRDVDSGNAYYIEMPATYRISDFRELESRYIREVSY